MSPRNFFSQLKRRNVIRMAGLYLVGAWLLTQVASTVLPMFGAPEWLPRSIVILLAIGFIPAIVFAWAFELTPSGLKRDEEVTPAESIAPQTARRMNRLIIAVLVLALLYFGFDKFVLAPRRESAFIASAQKHDASPTAAKPSAVINDRSIAVLPFENLSEDKANAFFASGIQDEILTALSRISGLKVVSRTSTARYQSSPQNLPEIARAVGAANILEGSVQRAGDKVHVNVQLIRADTDAHVWAQSYDRGLADIFAVEAEVARSVADELRATLSPEEKVRVATKPTENSEAYVLYLRANAILSPADLLEDLEKAVDLFTQAIALDSQFAVAHASLATVLAQIYLDFHPTEAIARRARSEAEESLRLKPDLAEGHHARGMCLYWIDKNYDAALQELATAERMLPNNADLEGDMAYIYRRQGRWQEALAKLKHAQALDPGLAPVAHEIFKTLYALRRWDEALAAGQAAVAVAPNAITFRLEIPYVHFWARGDLAPLQSAVAASPAGVDPDGQVTLAKWDAALLARDYDAAERAVTECVTEKVQGDLDTPLSKAYLRGSISLARGDHERARVLLEAARPGLEAEARDLPLDSSRHAQLGLLYAYLGRKEDSIREGRRAVELTPESRDALVGPMFNGVLATIYARCGEPEQAIALIEHLLTTPSATYLRAGSISLSDLRQRWQWDPLRNHPRFQKILASPEPKTIYN